MTAGTFIEDNTAYPKWTRVGFLQTSSYVSKEMFDFDNIQVTEVMPEKVLTRSLRAVCNDATALCVRRLCLKEEYPVYKNKKGSVDYKNEVAELAAIAEEKRQDLLAHFFTFIGIPNNLSNPRSAVITEGNRQDMLTNCLLTSHTQLGTIMGKPFSDPSIINSDKLAGMLEFYHHFCKTFQVPVEDITRLTHLVWLHSYRSIDIYIYMYTLIWVTRVIRVTRVI